MKSISTIITQVKSNETANSSQVNESDELVETFKDICGFSQKEAEEATYQVLIHEEYDLFDF